MGPYYDTAVIGRLPKGRRPLPPRRGAVAPILALLAVMLAAVLPRG